MAEATHASDRENRRITLHVADGVGADRDHADALVTFQHIASHLAIPGLEDVERNGDLRQQHDVGQRKESERFEAWHAPELSGRC